MGVKSRARNIIAQMRTERWGRIAPRRGYRCLSRLRKDGVLLAARSRPLVLERMKMILVAARRLLRTNGSIWVGRHLDSSRRPIIVSFVSNYPMHNGRKHKPTLNTDIRFSSSIAVQQKTDGIEAVVFYIRKTIHHVTRSRYNTAVYGLFTLMAYWLAANLLSTPSNGPVPDLIKVAGLAKSFEPVIYYSETGHAQVGELQDTGVAVWDLSESVRNTNMTSAPIIVNQLEDLSESLKGLSIEMISFFAGLDADVDAILLVMEWAGRELTTISHAPQTTMSSVYSNAHNLLTRVGVMSKDSKLIKELIGQTIQQQTRATLERTFNEFLNVMEESISNELQYSQKLFSLFEAIDKQFLNLHRTVTREQDTQERIQSDFLSSLWTRVVGVNNSKLRKYEKNRDLLQSVRDRTVRNKHVLVEHHQRLLQLKTSLDKLRQRLVTPLIRNTNSSTLSVDEQIKGLEGTYNDLKATRDTQKSKKLALIYGTREKRDALQMGTGMRPSAAEIGGRW